MSKNDIWHLYIIQCADNTLYTGITLDLERRFAEHNSNGVKCAKYLRGRQPLTMIYHNAIIGKSAALKAEIKVKKLARVKKLWLAQGRLTIEELMPETHDS